MVKGKGKVVPVLVKTYLLLN